MRTRNILAAVATIALLTSCTTDDNTPNAGSFPADGIIRVATNVTESPFQGGRANVTRAGMTDDNIKEFILKIENLSTDPEAAEKYSYYAAMQGSNANGWESYGFDADGKPTIDFTMLWQNSTQPVKVTAVRAGEFVSEEYFDQASRYGVFTSQNLDGYIELSDYLYMPTTTIYPNKTGGNDGLTADGKLPINFVHIMSKVNLTVTLATEFNVAPGTTTNPITALTVNGTKQWVNFNPSTGTTTDYNDPGNTPITPWHNAPAYTAGDATTTKAVAHYEVILAPQTVAAGEFIIAFTINGKKYEWTATADVTLVSGKQHELKLTVGKDIVTGSDITAEPWEPGMGGDKETE